MYENSSIEHLIVGLKTIVTQWNMSPETEISLINVSENATFLAVDSKLNKKNVLRVHPKSYHSIAEIESEMAWIQALRESQVVKTPRPVETDEGKLVTNVNDGTSNRYVVAFEFMEGEEPKVGDDLPEWFHTLGATTAKLHAHSKNWDRPGWFTRKAWNLENSIGANGLWGDWRNAIDLKDEGKEIISEAISVIETRLKSYGCSSDRFGLIHADLRLANLLVGDDLGVIDFDDCGFSWFAYDFAAAISFHELDPSVPTLQDSWLRGYRSVSFFSEEDEKELPTFIMLRRIMLTAWLASHPHAAESNELGSEYTDGTVELAKDFLKKSNVNNQDLLNPISNRSRLPMDKVSNILDHNAFNLKEIEDLDRGVSEMVKRRLQTVGPTTMLFYQEPLHIVRGKGVWLYDAKGKQYLDVYNNVPSLGHCHPKVVDAISRQLRKLNIHTRYLHENVHIYTERLLATMPDCIDRLVMTCTGSESNDLALRLARTFTKKKGIIVTEAAYHGNTASVTDVSPSALKAGALPAHVVTVSIDKLNSSGADAASVFCESVKNAIDTLDKRGYGCAAFLVDSIFSSDGVYSDPKGFLKKAVDLVQQRGGLFIADEVQPGFGRTGESMWGFQRHDVCPDIVTMGKPMGNGYPVSGVAARLDLLEALSEEAGYFNTFGGSAVAAAAGLAVLDVIKKEGIIEKTRKVGDYLKNGLLDLQSSYSSISQVRGVGLFIGVEFCRDGDPRVPNAEMASSVMNLLRQDQVLIGGAGKHGNCIKVRPPLCFNKLNADLLLKKLAKALKRLHG